jgi:hypothetical protein
LADERGTLSFSRHEREETDTRFEFD